MREDKMTIRRVAVLAIALLTLAAAYGQSLPSKGSRPLKPKDALARIGPDLKQLFEEHRAVASLMTARIQSPFRFLPSNRMMPYTADGTVVIDASAEEDPAALLRDLKRLGLQDGAIWGRLVSGRLPVMALPAAAQLPSLRTAYPAYSRTQAGPVTSQGDQVMKADAVHSIFGVTGDKIRVGVISDSFDYSGTHASADVSAGYLPADIIDLEEMSTYVSPPADEGRAMMQLIHNVAPGSRFAFHSGRNGMANFAQGIRALADKNGPGCQVIVDDVFLYTEPFFQDSIVAQAIDEVKQAGVAYFSAAGNFGHSSYEDAFRLASNGTSHNFRNEIGQEDIYQKIIIPYGHSIYLVLQWSDPFFSVSGPPGAATDLDIRLLDQNHTTVRSSFRINVIHGADDGATGDPLEIIDHTNLDPDHETFYIKIDWYEGPLPAKVKYVLVNDFDAVNIDQYPTFSSTCYGHANAAGALAVGAAYYLKTPLFGINPPVLESFSSAGGTPILFDSEGRPFANPVVRVKPEIVAPDGTDTSFFGSDTDGSGYPNFFGTSAAAPHAAAVAALMLDLFSGTPYTPSPDAIYHALESTAAPMGSPIPNDNSGYGFIQADLAFASLVGNTPGDFNNDGKIDLDDLVILIGRIKSGAPYRSFYDLNGDGRVDIADARVLVLHSPLMSFPTHK
jgi:subtilisin family serine protease